MYTQERQNMQAIFTSGAAYAVVALSESVGAGGKLVDHREN